MFKIIVSFFVKYFFKDTKYFFYYVFRFFDKSYTNKTLFLNEENFIENLKKGKSFIRIGDGEIGMVHFRDIHYEPYNPSLRKYLLNIIKSYNQSSKYIILIPVFVNYSNLELKRINKLFVWLPLKITYEILFNKKMFYFDAHIFYKDNSYKRIIEPLLKNKKTIIITNQKNIEKIKNSGKDFDHYVVCPDEKAFAETENLKKEVREIYSKNNYEKKDVTCLVSAGLSSKSIIFDLCKEDFQMFDLGKGVEQIFSEESLEYLI
jgi:hypothetical protein